MEVEEAKRTLVSAHHNLEGYDAEVHNCELFLISKTSGCFTTLNFDEEKVAYCGVLTTGESIEIPRCCLI